MGHLKGGSLLGSGLTRKNQTVKAREEQTLQLIEPIHKLWTKKFYTITNLDTVIDIAYKLTLSTLTLKVLALLLIRLYLSKASQASLLVLN